MNKRIISKVKSHTPIVKSSSFKTQRQRAIELENRNTDYLNTIRVLEKRNEIWAHEVRQLRLQIQRHEEYGRWLAVNYPSNELIEKQKKDSSKFKYRPLISIIMPVYNTNPEYLTVCINSVLAQSYDNFQLCIANDASTNEQTLKCLDKYRTKDKRIKITDLTKNGHISVASNRAIELAEGEYVALLDHDDFLWPNALFEVVSLLQAHPDADFIYSDEDKVGSKGLYHFFPFFKPDWSPHLLWSINYITHFSVLRTDIVHEVGGFNTETIGAQDWDLFLRVSEITDKIYHIPTILYSWRSHEGSTASSILSKKYAKDSQRKALLNHFSRIYPLREVKLIENDHDIYTPEFEIEGRPKVSIIIPTKDKVDYLEKCIASIFEKSQYNNYEIIIVDTGSIEEQTKEYYKWLKEEYSTRRLRLERFDKQPFNYSDSCNFGASLATGDYFLFLNNDTEVITNDWIAKLLGYAQQKDVGAVGAKLLFPNGQIQHAGVAIGIGSELPVAGHPLSCADSVTNDPITVIYSETIRDVTAVTAACLIVDKDIFKAIGGFDPKLRVTFNDVDLCLKIRKKGYKNIYLPSVSLYHHESISVGKTPDSRDMEELWKSALYIRKKWPGIIDNDGYYNKNFYKQSANLGLNIY